MSLTRETAKHLRAVYFGGNWTDVNYRDTLRGVTCEQARHTTEATNSILALVYHTSYFLQAIDDVLDERPLSTRDQYSFDHPAVETEEAWQAFLEQIWQRAEATAARIEQQPDTWLAQPFGDEKYGSCHTNLHGIIEHLHYHLGQIVLLKKRLSQGE